MRLPSVEVVAITACLLFVFVMVLKRSGGGDDGPSSARSKPYTKPSQEPTDNDASVVTGNAELEGEQYRIDSETITQGRVTKYRPYSGDKQLRFSEVFKHWQNSRTFREKFMTSLKESPFKAFFFETPKVSGDTMDKLNFEYVLVNANSLVDVDPDIHAFQEHFDKCSPDQTSTSFPNLGRDALMITPCPAEKPVSKYNHLASFVRKGSDEQLHQFWSLVGREAERWISSRGERSTWLSTSGLGVYWLHMRLDSRPKYYTFQPYKQ